MSLFRNKAREEKKVNYEKGEIPYNDCVICLNAKLNGMKRYLIDSEGYEQGFTELYRRAILTAIAKEDRKYFELAQKARELYEGIALIKLDCVEKMRKLGGLEEIAESKDNDKEVIQEYIPKPSPENF